VPAASPLRLVAFEVEMARWRAGVHYRCTKFTRGVILLNVENILFELKQQLNRIEGAVAAIESIGGKAHSGKRGRGRHRTMSAAARARISAGMKKRWAARKGKKVTSSAKKASRGGISAAGRKRISEMMKKRWAERKKAQGAQA
jgi:hypothetical protein